MVLDRRSLSLCLLIPSALLLVALGLLVSATATSRGGNLGLAYPQHLVARHLLASALAVGAGFGVARLGAARLLRSAPYVFLLALIAGLAVFIPGVGVRAAGASRWLHIGPLSGGPAPFVALGVGLLIAAWADSRRAPAPQSVEDALPRSLLALAMTFVAVLTLIVQPDLSAAGVTILVALVALAGVGVGGRWLIPAAGVLALALGVVASQFRYVGGRWQGFWAPLADRRGKGFEVLALAHAGGRAGAVGVGLGHGSTRHLSSPESDYVFAVIAEELGKIAAAAVVVAWLCIGAAALLAARRANDRRQRALALAAGTALLAPALLHVAVCVGAVPIIGVSMPLVSYDPAAVLAAGAEIGLIATVAGSAGAPA